MNQNEGLENYIKQIKEFKNHIFEIDDNKFLQNISPFYEMKLNSLEDEFNHHFLIFKLIQQVLYQEHETLKVKALPSEDIFRKTSLLKTNFKYFYQQDKNIVEFSNESFFFNKSKCYKNTFLNFTGLNLFHKFNPVNAYKFREIFLFSQLKDFNFYTGHFQFFFKNFSTHLKNKNIGHQLYESDNSFHLIIDDVKIFNKDLITAFNESIIFFSAFKNSNNIQENETLLKNIFEEKTIFTLNKAIMYSDVGKTNLNKHITRKF